MNEKLKRHFLKIGPRNFVVGAVILMIILDILNGIYLKIVFNQNRLTERTIHLMFKQMEVSAADFDQTTLLEMSGLIEKSTDFFLFLVLLNNLFFYFFYLRKKLWAQGYVLFYTLTAAIFSLITIFDSWEMGPEWLVFNLLSIPLYIYLYLGVKLLKNETTLEPKKKGL